MSARANLLGQIFRFVVVGLIGLVLNALLVEGIARAWGPLYAQLIAFPFVVSVMWYLNRRYTFGASRQPIAHEWLRYVFANTLGWAANNGVYVLLVLHWSLAFRHPSIAVAAGSLSGMVFNFVISRFVVFKQA